MLTDRQMATEPTNTISPPVNQGSGELKIGQISDKSCKISIKPKVQSLKGMNSPAEETNKSKCFGKKSFTLLPL